MPRPRIIPVLLLKGRGLVKSIRFKDHRYIGEPVNAARIFNELHADELVFLDIDASREGRAISLDLVRAVAEEVTMPFSVGGGLRTLDDIRAVISAGVEKAIIGTHASEAPDFVKKASNEFGSSTISVCLDVKKSLLGRNIVRVRNGRRKTNFEAVEYARLMESNGAGELIVQSIDRDGTFSGYDIELVESVASAVTIPVVALGGAGSVDDLADVWRLGHANGVAAGSLFVYHSKQRGVLINYPVDKRSFRSSGKTDKNDRSSL